MLQIGDRVKVFTTDGVGEIIDMGTDSGGVWYRTDVDGIRSEDELSKILEYDEFPDVLKAVTQVYEDIYIETGLTYDTCTMFKEQCEFIGYSFDFGLDAEPFDFHKLEIKK